MKVSVVKCSSYDEEKVYQAVKKSIDLIGGIHIKPGSKVLIKPNVLSARKPDAGITTHPSVIGAVCRLLKPFNVNIVIGDSSGMGLYGYTDRALGVAGIKDVAKKYNAECVSFEGKSTKVKIDGARVLREANIAQPVLDADYIINLPKLKTHTLMKYTGAVKNLLGCIPGGGKAYCHTIAPKAMHFGHLLVDLYSKIRPQLNIIDGIVGLEGNGPGSAGTPIKSGIIIASKNAVAADLVGAEIIGYKPMEIETSKQAVERKIFTEKPELVGEKVSIKFKQPLNIKYPAFVERFMFRQAMLRPVITREECKACELCIKACPKHTIKLVKGKAFIVDKNCIRCYCCHEMCPYNAIELKKPPFRKLIDFGKSILAKLRA